MSWALRLNKSNLGSRVLNQATTKSQTHANAATRNQTTALPREITAIDLEQGGVGQAMEAERAYRQFDHQTTPEYAGANEESSPFFAKNYSPLRMQPEETNEPMPQLTQPPETLNSSGGFGQKKYGPFIWYPGMIHVCRMPDSSSLGLKWHGEEKVSGVLRIKQFMMRLLTRLAPP